MTGPEHYREAEQLLAGTWPEGNNPPIHHAPTDAAIAQAQVHATLALAAAMAGAGRQVPAAIRTAWQEVTS